MKDLASKRLQGSSENVYLDSSLIAGAAGDVARLIVASDVRTFEDDRAVFTDYMLRNPSLIILDYEQQIFGASRKPPMSMIEKKCFVADDVTSLIRRLDNVEAEKQPLFIFTPKDLGCGSTVENLIPNYPVWDNKGIVLKPILDHIDRVAEMKESIVLPPYYGRKPDYRQGPEVPYIIDDKGVWTSRLIRDRTNHETAYWRMIPTEGLTKVAHGVLMNEDMRSGRWNRLKTTVRSGGFPYWSW